MTIAIGGLGLPTVEAPVVSGRPRFFLPSFKIKLHVLFLRSWHLPLAQILVCLRSFGIPLYPTVFSKDSCICYLPFYSFAGLTYRLISPPSTCILCSIRLSRYPLSSALLPVDSTSFAAFPKSEGRTDPSTPDLPMIPSQCLVLFVPVFHPNHINYTDL